MKNTKLVVPVLVLLAVSLSCKLVDRLRSSGEVSGDFSKVAGNLANYDPEDPPPSPGAAALQQLAELEPSVDKLVGDVEAAERAALKTGIAELRAQRRDGNNTDQGSPPLQLEASRAVPIVARSFGSQASSSSLALYALQGRVDAAIGGLHASALIAGLTSGLNEIFAPHLQVGANANKSVTETKGGATSTMSVEFGRADDGTSKFGLGLKTEVSKDGVSAKAELASKIDGQRCPNAEGQLPFTIKVRLGAESGGSVYTRELTAMVRAVVNDDANAESYTMDLTQGTRQVKDGVAVYIETATTMKEEGGNYTDSNFRVIRHSQQATAKNAEPLSIAGLEAAFATGLTALRIAEHSWRRGGCTKIEAPSPGAVEPSSTTPIPVTVRHKFDGSEVPSKLEAELKGETSVDPTTLAKTSGTLTYTAPGEPGKSATITLIATSRRGRATLDLTASTGGGSYQIVGGLDDWQTNTAVCDIMNRLRSPAAGSL